MNLTCFCCITFVFVLSSCKQKVSHDENKQNTTSSVFSTEVVNIPNARAQSLYEESLRRGKENDFQGELSLLLKADSLCPHQPCIVTNLGTCYATQGVDNIAIEYYNQALKLDSNYSKIYVNYSKLLNRQKRFKEAVSMADRGLNCDSLPDLNKKMLYFNLAIADYYLHLYDQALGAVKKADSCTSTEFKKDALDNLERQIRTEMNMQ